MDKKKTSVKKVSKATNSKLHPKKLVSKVPEAKILDEDPDDNISDIDEIDGNDEKPNKSNKVNKNGGKSDNGDKVDEGNKSIKSIKSNDNSNNNSDISNEFKEKVITYIKCDDLIRQKMDEVKELKEKKKPCEDYIIKYLESKDAPFVKVKDGKLVKSRSESKGGLKAELIKDSIMEGIKGQKLTADEIKSHDITAKIMDIMENKRTKTVRVALKRTIQSNEKEKKKSENKQEN